jgi:WD40 repeat protein
MSRMKRISGIFIVLAGLAADTGQRLDRYGDPLPSEALARMGSVRFRQGATIHSVAFTPDGGAVISHGWGDNGVCVWDAAAGKEIRRFCQQPDKLPISSCLSPDGKLVAAVSGNNGPGISLWDPATGRALRELGRRRYRSACFAPDSKILAAFALDGTLELLDPASGDVVRSWDAHAGGAWYGVFTPQGKSLVSSGADGSVRIWELATAIQLLQIDANPHPDVPPALAPNGKLVAVVGQANAGGTRPSPERRVRAWDVASGKELRQLTAPAGVTSLAFAPDGILLFGGCEDRTVRVWDAMTGKELRHFAGYSAAKLPLAFSANGKTLAVGDGATLRLCDAETGKDRRGSGGHPTWIYAAALSHDGKTLATGGQGGAIQLWDATCGRELRRLAGHEKSVLALAMSADGRTLYSAGADKAVRAWDVSGGKQLRVISGSEPTRLDCLALSPDGANLGVAGPENSVLLIDSATGKQRRTLRGLELPVNGLSFAPDGTLISWTRDQSITVWDPATGQRLRQFATGEARQRPLPGGGTGYVGYAAAVSADGRLVALGEQERSIFVLDATTGKEVRRLTGLADSVWALAFSPDGRTLAWGGGNDPAVRLVELATGQERHAFFGHRGRVVCLTFAADGRTLISAGADTTALVWDLTGKLAVSGMPAKPLTRAGLDACWNELGDADAPRAWHTIRRLDAASESITYLEKRLEPIPPVVPGRLARLIAELDSDKFEVRQRAGEELEGLGEAAAGACRKALQGRPSAEARRRLEELLEKVTLQMWSPSVERLRTLRALEALELASSVEAARLLKTLARGAPGAWLTEAAKAALARQSSTRSGSP